MPSESTRWAALLLKQQLDSASTDEERQRVLRDIERSRKDPRFRARLAQIAEHGKWSSGAPLMTKLALGAGTLAGVIPGLQPLGLASGAALAGMAVPTGLEAMERRSEGLPWKWQAAESVLDLGAPGASKLLRGLRGVKAGVKEAPIAFEPGFSYPGLSQRLTPAHPVSTGPLKSTPTQHPFLAAPGVPKETYASGTAATRKMAEKAMSEELDELLPSTLTKGQATGGGALGESLAHIPEVPLGQAADLLGPTKTGYVLKMPPAGFQPGVTGISSTEFRDVPPNLTREDIARYLRFDRPLDIPEGLPVPDATGRIPFTGVRTWMSKRPTSARSRQYRADAENEAAEQLGREHPHNDKKLAALEEASDLEVKTNEVLDDMEASRSSIDQNMGPGQTVAPRGTPGAAPSSAHPPLAATKVGQTIQNLGDDIVESTSRVAARVEDRVLTTIKGSPKIRDLSDSQLHSILERRQTSRTGPQMAGFAEEREAIEEALANRIPVHQERAGVRPGQTAAAQVDEVVEGGARQEVSTPMEFVERRATIDPILAKGAVQMQALDEVALMIGQAGDEVFEVYGQVGPTLTRTAVTSPGPQRGLLREIVATQQRPIKKGPPVEGPAGSSMAYMFGHRPGYRPVGGTRPEFEVFESGRGPGSESKRAKGPRVIETWFAGQRKIFGEAAFKKTKRLNENEVRQFAADLHRDGITEGAITPEMLTKVREKMTGIEKTILDQAVMFSIIAQRGGMFKKVIARTTGMTSRIKEFRGKGKEAILDEMTGAYQTFMKTGTIKERQSIIDAANEFTKYIGMLLASIAGAEMMELSGDPRATAG